MDTYLDPLEIEINKLFQNKIIKRFEDEMVLDLNILKEEDLELFDKFVVDPINFITLCRKYVRSVYGHLLFKIKNFDDGKEDISNLRKTHLGNLVRIRGLISKTTKVMAETVGKTYECQSCGTVISTKGIKPTKCSCGYRGKNFKDIKTTLRDIQEIEIEELQEDIFGRQPQKIRIRLTDRLTHKTYYSIVQPGNKVSVTGIIEKIPLNTKMEGEELFIYRIFAIDIENLEEDYDDKISDGDLADLEEIANSNPIKQLANSLAPNIYGNEELKKMLVLQMVSGVKKEMKDGKFTRERIHILVIGDPATSKTELAKNVNIRCPKSYYSSGDNSTSAGLTATVEKDDLTGSWGVKVGPICKANGSINIIDEIDKAHRNNLLALHTPMESGIVALSKAGIDTKIPAESSILALANPKHGMFNLEKPLVEQINLPAPLLSRFDIVYIMKDKIDKDYDDKIVDIIYSQGLNESESNISVNLFRKYINHAKRFKPKLSSKNVNVLKEFYHETRKKSISRDSQMKGMPIGARHLQGIIRLAEASAKIRFSKTVDKEDMILAKELFYNSLVQIGLDEGGFIDMARASAGRTISKRKIYDFMLDTIRQVCSGGKIITNQELKRIMVEKGVETNDYDRLINSLNTDGYILKSGGGWKQA